MVGHARRLRCLPSGRHPAGCPVRVLLLGEARLGWPHAAAGPVGRRRFPAVPPDRDRSRQPDSAVRHPAVDAGRPLQASAPPEPDVGQRWAVFGCPLTVREEWHAVSVRRREFLTAAAGVLALVGCARHRLADASPRPAAGLPGVPATAAAPAGGSASSAGPPAGAAATRGSPEEILQRSTVPALCYHQVREHSAADSGGARSLICPPAVLEGHLRALTQAGMQPVTSTQLVDHLEWGSPLPPRPVMISFDDASAGHFTAALPILQRLEIPATFFVMTVVLDKPGWLSRDQVRRLDHGRHDDRHAHLGPPPGDHLHRAGLGARSWSGPRPS